MAPNWKPEEVAAACKAYASATNNGEVGADQDVEKFNSDILEKLQMLAPANCVAGTYHNRGDRVYPYLRDNVFGDVQKFQKALRMVNLSEPSGVTEQQKLNMAVAIHLKKAPKMEYSLKDFDPCKWRFYLSYLQLKCLNKFQCNNQQVVLTTENQEAVSDLEGATSGDSTGSSNQDTAIERHEKARGGGRGRTHSKKAKVEEEKSKRKRKREDERDQRMDAMLHSISDMQSLFRRKAMASILTKAAAAASDPQQKAELEGKLIQLALEGI